MTDRLIEFIQRLEGKSAAKRKQIVLDYLSAEKISYELHRYREFFIPTENIIVSKPGTRDKEILLLSHYDTYHRNPGANDNASGIAVSLDVFKKLSDVSTYCTIKAIIFDDEEPSPLRPRPCFGSRKYVRKYGVQGICGVFCLELCGMGDTVVVFPVSKKDENSQMLSTINNTCAKAKINYVFVPPMPGFTSDYMPFRKAGIPEAFCFSMVPSSEGEKWLKISSSSISMLLLKYEIPKFLGIVGHLPGQYRNYHTKRDRVKHLSENSLQVMSNVLFQAILAFDINIKNKYEKRIQ